MNPGQSPRQDEFPTLESPAGYLDSVRAAPADPSGENGSLRADFNEVQRRRLNDAPESCKGVLIRAYRGRSPAAGIKAFCLQCVGYVRADVRDCTALGCPLFLYRPFQRDDEPDDAPEPLAAAENAA